jgi:hypothetical protein
MSAWFKQVIGGEKPWVHNVEWERSGETLENLTLNLSFLAFDHYHWVRNGELQVDSPFNCKKKGL